MIDDMMAAAQTALGPWPLPDAASEAGVSLLRPIGFLAC